MQAAIAFIVTALVMCPIAYYVGYTSRSFLKYVLVPTVIIYWLIIILYKFL